MNILIIGSGSVGTALAAELDEKGHDVSVVDRTEEDLESLPAKFGGFTTVGVPIDMDILKRAGIESCDALFAVTNEDDLNIMASQLAQRVFRVPKIFARITDIEKGRLFEEIGVNVICPTKLTVSAACAALEENNDRAVELNFENHTVIFSTIELPEDMEESSPDDIEYEDGEILFGVIRKGSGFIMYRGQPLTFQKSDKLVFARRA